MKASQTQAAYDAWIDLPGNAEYLASDLLQDRIGRMFKWFDKEPVTVIQAAMFLRLPLDVFVHLYAGFLTMEALSMGEPPTETRN